jgi:hypothetical protein
MNDVPVHEYAFLLLEKAADASEDAGKNEIDSKQVDAEKQREDDNGNGGLDHVILARPGDFFHFTPDVSEVRAHAFEYIFFFFHVAMQVRRDSNPQPPVLETGALPLSY